MNTITIVGNLVRDPELTYKETGVVFAHFTLADNGYSKSEQTTIFWNVTMFGNVAETFCNEFVKGREYTIKGICVPNEYTDKNGSKHHEIRLIAECYKNGRKPKDKTNKESNTESTKK